MARDRKEYSREYYAANKEKIKAKSRARCAANKEEIKVQREARHLANPERRRSKRLKSLYGLTLEQYDRMFAEQGGVCAACKKDCGPRGLQVDHCHTTGKVRGLLCGRCNISVCNDTPEDLFQRGWFLVRDLI